ncbi:putative zinc-binding alcohol dehydrogenase domain-containing protein cipB [Xylariaceae sp. FL0804]|nr:putative zinc-binding alcohol dehydrogenase domain-containing protein cipB [Xylariaceae sp. FL0804]
MPSNTAAYIVEAGKALEVREAPYPLPGEHQLVIENRSVALNPADFVLYQMGPDFFPKGALSSDTLPMTFGFDVAGNVMAVGAAVTDFKVGDRVLAMSDVAFQKYPAILDQVAARVPESVTYEQASVVGVALATAAVGLFHADNLALDLPKPGSRPAPDGKTKAVLITAGASSVGCNAVQMAAAAGYEVFTTASPKNFEYLRGLGASQVFDYGSASLDEDIAAALKGKTVAGALAIGAIDHSAYKAILDTCAAAVTSTEGRPFIALTMVPPATLPEGVQTNFVNCMAVRDDRRLANAIYRDYLTEAMAAGTFTPAPPAKVVGHGLEAIEPALEQLKKGVSASKLVVTL